MHVVQRDASPILKSKVVWYKGGAGVPPEGGAVCYSETLAPASGAGANPFKENQEGIVVEQPTTALQGFFAGIVKMSPQQRQHIQDSSNNEGFMDIVIPCDGEFLHNVALDGAHVRGNFVKIKDQSWALEDDGATQTANSIGKCVTSGTYNYDSTQANPRGPISGLL